MSQNLEQKINSRINKDLKKKLIHSNFTISDYVDSDDFDEKEVDVIITQLYNDKKIYIFGDSKSYMENVRNKGYISISEKMMMNSLKENKHKVIFRDLEFPIDSTGKYVFEEDKLNKFYVVGGEKYYKSEIL